MPIVYPNNCESITLQLLVNKITTTENLVLRLYSNDVTPSETSTAGTFTEASGSGYAAKTLTGASWTVSGTSPTAITYAEQTFAFTGALGNVYGYYYTRASTGDLIAAERFSGAPQNIQYNGEEIRITPILTLK